LVNVLGPAVGTRSVYQNSHPRSIFSSSGTGSGVPYFSSSTSLNILLALLTVVQRILHNRSIQRATCAQGRTSGAYSAIVTMLIDCSSLSAVASLLSVGTWGAGVWVWDIFLQTLSQIQVRNILMFPKGAAISSYGHLIMVVNRFRSIPHHPLSWLEIDTKIS